MKVLYAFERRCPGKFSNQKGKECIFNNWDLLNHSLDQVPDC